MRRRSASDPILRRGTQFVLLATAVLAARGLTAEEAGSGDLTSAISDRVREVFEHNRDAVVRIESSDQHGRLSGTGFYADPSGTVYTHVGVIGDAADIMVYQGVRKFPARFLVSDPRTGIALLKVDANTPFLPIGDSSTLEVATPVLAIGYPQNRMTEPSLGIVAGFDIEYLNRLFRTTHIRLNLPVQRGLGGAPVLDLNGKVVGIIVSGIDGNSGCHMLPINAAEKVRL
ncbi:MAG: S1C family serine protease, partial [Limisphaerales bacterium]